MKSKIKLSYFDSIASKLSALCTSVSRLVRTCASRVDVCGTQHKTERRPAVSLQTLCTRVLQCLLSTRSEKLNYRMTIVFASRWFSVGYGNSWSRDRSGDNTDKDHRWVKALAARSTEQKLLKWTMPLCWLSSFMWNWLFFYLFQTRDKLFYTSETNWKCSMTL